MLGKMWRRTEHETEEKEILIENEKNLDKKKKEEDLSH